MENQGSNTFSHQKITYQHQNFPHQILPFWHQLITYLHQFFESLKIILILFWHLIITYSHQIHISNNIVSAPNNSILAPNIILNINHYFRLGQVPAPRRGQADKFRGSEQTVQVFLAQVKVATITLGQVRSLPPAGAMQTRLEVLSRQVRCSWLRLNRTRASKVSLGIYQISGQNWIKLKLGAESRILGTKVTKNLFLGASS